MELCLKQAPSDGRKAGMAKCLTEFYVIESGNMQNETKSIENMRESA
jgi:hypothetical protein